eukprot:s4969_g4.t1
MTKWTDPPEQGPPDAGLVKEAQGITGALLWVSTRSRPDVAYAVSRMGQQATKVPELSIAIGRQVLQYLNSTLNYGIEYLYEAGPYFSNHGQLAVPRQKNVLEVYSDASHSPCGGRSVQSVVIVWRGSPLAWERTRQSFTTLSSAEAELVGMTHAVQLAESVQPMVDELIADDSMIALLADNSAAVRAYEASPSGWRNRHLRMRAQAGRERIENNLLQVSHLPGEFQERDEAHVEAKRIPLNTGEAETPSDRGSESSEEFDQAQWEQAQAKLINEERRTGLTFLQRARLRRQLHAGGVVDVPVFQQRYGPLPSWF